MSLIPLTVVHAEVLAALHVTGFSSPWDAPAFQDLLLTPGVFGWLAVDDQDQPLGFCLGRVAVDEAELLTICMSPAARGRGLSHKLMESLLNSARDNGAATMFLEVSVENAAALHLYGRHGFSEVGRRRGYYLEPAETGSRRVDAYVMSRVLVEEISANP